MKYTGGCHCQKVRFQVETEIKEVLACNCSICSKRAHLLAFVGESEFSLQSGKESLKDYQFGKKHLHHLFCSDCGIAVFGSGAGPDGKKMYAINTRCLDDIDATQFPVKHYDGKSL